MGTPTAQQVAGPGGPAEPVPVAFTGRTSTLGLQDPVASLRRQARECQAKLPAGWFIAAWYWDIESGGLDIEQRGHSATWQQVDVGIPRDGGLADLLAEARSPAPRFAAVICEDIERSGRDTYNALKLEKELAGHGIPLFATDEPISIDGMNATTVLVRRVKQGVAEWFRLQIKEKSWRGLREHSLAGWNIGHPPYGYTADRVAHPVPVKAAQGRTKTRLAPDPGRAPVVAQIYAWRTTGKLGAITITARLNADHGAYPPPSPETGWTPAGVYKILANPKYTGHMVYGRRRTVNGKTRPVPPDQWIWTPEPVHPAIIDRATWDAAQAAGAEHATSPDLRPPGAGSAAGRRTYVLRSRLRCRIDNRRMAGATRMHAAGPDTYYLCPHNPASPRHAAQAPDHPRTVAAREDQLLGAIRQFFDERIFGPERAALLTALLPATAAASTARKDKQAASLDKRLRQIDLAENAHAREIEALAHTQAPATAITALRTRIVARFTELEEERAAITSQLNALAAPDTSHPGDPALLENLPHLAGLLTDAPVRLQQQLYDAFDLQLLYSRKHHQVTIRATITRSTPATVAAIIHDSQQLAVTSTHASSHLSSLPITRVIRTLERMGGLDEAGDAVEDEQRPADRQGAGDDGVPVGAQPVVERLEPARRRLGRGQVQQERQPHERHVDGHDRRQRQRAVYDAGVGGRDDLDGRHEAGRGNEDHDPGRERGQRSRPGHQPGDQPRLLLLGRIGGLRLAAGHEDAAAQRQGAQPDPDPVPGRPVGRQAQPAGPQRGQDDHAHDHGHRDRAGQEPQRGPARARRAQVDGADQDRGRGQGGQDGETGGGS
jgi:site-specific DNA recombinase